MADNLPAGVEQESGILVFQGQHIMTSVVADQFVDWHTNLGPGQFVVGLWGCNYRYNVAPTTTEATIMLVTDPQGTTGIGTIGDQLFAHREESAAPMNYRGHHQELSAPILVATDMRVLMSNAIANGAFEWEYYYAIYRVTSSAFLRIAGVNLSR